VLSGLGEVSANNRAAARLSAKTLNSVSVTLG